MSEMNKKESSNGAVEGSKSSNNLCKKYKKIKYEIEMQNFKINQLKEDLKAKTANSFPQQVIDDLSGEIEYESCKLDKMIKIAMAEQAQHKDDDCEWGAISVNDKQFSRPPKTPSDISDVSGIDIDKVLQMNQTMEDDLCCLHEEVLAKDQSICDLHNKISALQQQMCSISKANNDMACRLAEKKNNNEENKQLKMEIEYCKKFKESLSSNIQTMEAHLKELRCEFNCLKRDKELLYQYNLPQQQDSCKSNENENDKIKQYKEQYEQLLEEYCKKDKEHKEITNRLKKCLKNNECDMERAENEALRKETEHLIKEIEDYRILIKELQTQIELYRDKFMKAQERVETQKLKIEKLESSKNSIECQVNEEIERIKEKFQEKLNELCPYPEKYAESRAELEKAKSRIEILEREVEEVSNELWKAKCELKSLKDQPRDSVVEKYELMQVELEEQQKKYCALKKTKDCLEEKLCSMKQELENLRRDSAKIITTTKCTADKNRQILHEQINCLEFELAQCRATASLGLTEKEEIIKQLKQELNTLCGHFNGCQGQIRQLKDQIEYLTKKRYKDSEKNLDCYELFSNK